MLSFEEAIQKRTIEIEEENRKKEQCRQRARNDRARREACAVNDFREWLVTYYDFDTSRLDILAAEYQNDKTAYAVAVEFDNGKVRCKAPFRTGEGIVIGDRCPAIWHAVRNEYGMDFENFLDAVIYAIGR